MKNLLLSLAFLLSLGVVAQDTIYTRKGEVIPAKVQEVGTTDIKYRKPSNPEGPLYVISKEDVALIEYNNGSKDVFQSDNMDDTYKTAGSRSSDTYNQDRRVRVVVNPLVVGLGWGLYRPWRWHHRHWRCGWWW